MRKVSYILLLFCGFFNVISSLIHDEPSAPKTPITLENLDTSVLPKLNECGSIRETPRIYGGTAAQLGEFPWIAGIEYKSVDDHQDIPRTLCAGSLISSRYVLTAGSCLKAPNKIPAAVFLGESKVSTNPDCVNNECADPVQKVAIRTVLPHPGYNAKTSENDIGLLYLERDVSYSDFIQPICLPPKNLPFPREGEHVTVTGWGKTENGKLSDILLKIDLPITSSEECGKKLKREITENRFCAGGEAGKDSCLGDSGAPAMHVFSDDNNKPRWYQQGIVSFGAGCGRAGYSGVYTKVEKYTDWIVSTIKNNNAL